MAEPKSGNVTRRYLLGDWYCPTDGCHMHNFAKVCVDFIRYKFNDSEQHAFDAAMSDLSRPMRTMMKIQVKIIQMDSSKLPT